MQNIEKLINLQRRFEKDIRFFVDKEDYVSFKKVIEDFIIEAGKLNPDINTRDLLSRHLSKAGKVKSYSDALQIINSVSSDITLLSMDLHGKGEPIYTMVELDKLKRDNNIEFTKNSFDIFKKSFDLLKKNNSDRFSKIDDLRSLYLGNVKNYKDKVFKFPHLVDTEQRKLFNILKDNITKQVFDTFEKDREILLSYLSEIAEIGKAYVDRNVDYSDRFLDGYNIQKRREIIGESVDTEKLRKDLDKSNEKNIDSLIDSIKKCFDSYIKGVENLMTEHSKLYNDRIERTRAERVILGGQDEIKGIIERYKKQLEDIITSELSKDEEVFYSILGELKNSVNESDGDTNLYEVSGEFEYNIKYNFGRLRDDVLDDFDLMKKKQIDLQKEHLQKILNGENVNQDISKEIMDIIKDYEYKTESLYKRFRDDIQVDCENFIENLYDIYTGNVDKNKAKDFAKRFVSKGLSDVQEIERNLIYKTNMEMKKVSMESYKNLISKPFTKRDIDTHIGELISFYEDRRERTEGFFDLGWKKVKKTSENFINEFGLDVVYLNENHLNEDKESLEKINEEKYYPGYHFLDQIRFKIKNHIEDGNADKLQRDITGLVDISAGLMERFILDLLNKTLVPKIREIFNELNFEFGISPAQVRDDITNWWRKIEFGNKLILKKYLRSGMGDQFDLFIKRKYRRLKPNEIGLSQVIEFVKGEYEAYSMEFNNMVVEILNGYDVTYSRYSKFKDISDTARKLAKDFQREKWVYRSFFVKHNNMIEECIEDFLSAYQKGDYHNERWSYPYDDWYKDRNFYRVVEVELSNAYYRSVKDHEISGRGRYKGYSTVMDESDSISESRRDTFFEAEEEKKPKISKEEKEKLKAQLDNFFADKKEAKATELKKSIADRDKAIEDVILKYSTEKENIQREYSKNIQASKSEAEANKLRAERDEELQRLSLEKATSIEDLKERQKKEEASIREKYQSLFDKKLEEYKDSLGDAIGDFAKDIERGIEDGIRKNPIFQ